MMAVLVAAAAVCAAHFLNPHPHAIRNGADAISTGFDNWDATFPATPKDRAFWKSDWSSIYVARREGAVWHLIPHGVRFRGQGTHVWLDAKTGCITKDISFD
jgi:hypothetical protein